MPIRIPAALPDPGQLWPWQGEAVAAWTRAGRRGIVAAATGTGKTKVAQAAMERFWTGRERIAVVVPSLTLQYQWVTGLARWLAVPESSIGALGGGALGVDANAGIVVAVINSARDGLNALSAGWAAEGRQAMLIVDECHWAGSTANALIFDSQFEATLGLSATPERLDDGFEDVLVPELGPVVYRYPLRQALDDGVLAPLRSLNVYFDLAEAEYNALAAIERSLEAARARAERNVSGATAQPRRVAELERERATLLEGAVGRRPVIRSTLRQISNLHQPTVVFHERVVEAERTLEDLERDGLAAVLESATSSTRQRQAALRTFRNGRAQFLVAVRTLDEGVDLPDAKVAVITSGTSTTRQRVQRIGRVVRRTGALGTVVTLLARGSCEEWAVGQRDRGLLGAGRTADIGWGDSSDLLSALDGVTAEDPSAPLWDLGSP